MQPAAMAGPPSDFQTKEKPMFSNPTFRAALLAASLVAFAVPAATQDHSGHGSHASGHTGGQVDQSPSRKAFAEANDRMHADMAIDYSGDADVDFVKGMIPHHQGAIDMAKILLEHGKDPELKKLAEDIIAAQTTEIAQMQVWLKARGH
jgi:uncharacterized protein (DUF305 family)